MLIKSQKHIRMEVAAGDIKIYLCRYLYISIYIYIYVERERERERERESLSVKGTEITGRSPSTGYLMIHPKYLLFSQFLFSFLQ